MLRGVSLFSSAALPLAERALLSAIQLAQHALGTVTLLLVRINQQDAEQGSQPDEAHALVRDKSMEAMLYLIRYNSRFRRIASPATS
jgi:hypothetical protein